MLLRQQRMPGAHVEAAADARQRADVEQAVARHAARVGDEELVLFPLQALHQVLRIPEEHANRHVGIALAQFRDRRGHEQGGGKGAGADGHVADFPLAVHRHVAFEPLALQQERPCAFDEERAGGRRPGLDAAAVEQLHAQFRLRGLDAAAEGRLAQVHALGGAAETSFARERDDMFQPAQVHPGFLL
jgi:hypothetical protein